MRLTDIPLQTRKLFLIEFTKELIKTQHKYEQVIEEDILKKKSREIAERRIKEKEKSLQEQKEKKAEWEEHKKELASRYNLKIEQKPVIAINIQPKKLPPPAWKRLIPQRAKIISPKRVNVKIHRLRTEPKRLNLGRLNILAGDPIITTIICSGAGKDVEIKRGGKMMKVIIKLTQREIEQIIQTFSRVSKIPVTEGSFRAVVGSLIISAIISSESITQSFTISKILPKI
jgi:hypothetical protein